MLKKLMLMGTALTLAPNILLAEPATVIRNSQFRAKPLLDAPVLSTLNEGAAIDLISNEGGWSKIKTADGKVGFIRLLNLRTSNSSSTSALGGVDKLGNVARTGSTSNVATTGVKGISKDDIAQSVPNPEEVKKMESYASTEADARKAAKSVKLAEQFVPFLGEKL